jgi:hypothetical protein
MSQLSRNNKIIKTAAAFKMSEELRLYRTALRKGDRIPAFSHLERIHILSQPFPVKHTVIHLRMLFFAVRFVKPAEILVQLLYSLFSAKASLLNIFPPGNTGGANAIKKGAMPVPGDLKAFIVK